MVAENHQGKGLGRQLVEYAVRNAKQRGYKRIEVGTGNSSIGQLALYQKCGFGIEGVDKEYFIKHYPEEIFEDGIQCWGMVRLSQNLTQFHETEPTIGGLCDTKSWFEKRHYWPYVISIALYDCAWVLVWGFI